MNFYIHRMLFAKESTLFCITGGLSDLQLLSVKVTLFQWIKHKSVCILFYYLWSGITGVEVGVTHIILSGTILKSLFAVILTFQIVMQKKALKIGYGMIPQKREWLASLCTLEKKGVNARFLSGWIFSGRDE